jgi:hypothetical protein
MRPLDATVEARLSMWGIPKKAMDILAGTTETFERRSKKSWTIEGEVASKGILIYER